MKKRLLAVGLACLMCVTSFTAFAVKREETESVADAKRSPNLTPWGSFDTEFDLNRWKTDTWSESKWVSDSNGGYMSTATTRAWEGTRLGQIPLVVGETYDIYFDVKTATGEKDTLGTSGLAVANVTGVYPVTSAWAPTDTTIGKEWKTFHRSYTVTQTEDGAGKDLTKNCSWNMIFRRNAGNGAWLDIDNIKVYARGDVPYDWDNYINMLNHRVDSDNADDGYVDEIEVKDSDFADVANNHWAAGTIKALAASSYIQGMGNGTYAPEGNVTRAEFVTLAINTLGYKTKKYEDLYNDVKADQWFADNVQTAHALGLINENMVADGYFYPDKAITREEAATILAELAKLRKDTSAEAKAGFSDADSITDWAKNSVDITVGYGLFGGYPDGTFKPKGTITRAETAEVFFRLIELDSRLAVYVDNTRGSDKNNGTKNAPLKTIEAARDMVQPYLEKMQHHIFVYINEGTYNLTDTVYWNTEDSGQNGFNVVYTSLSSEKPEFRMAEDYNDFKLYDEHKNIWRVYVGKDNPSRDVFINGVRAVRARSAARYDGLDNVDFTEDTLINGVRNGPANATAGTDVYYMCDNLELADFKNQEYIELVFNEQWLQHRLIVESMYRVGDSVRIDMTEHSRTLQNDGVGNTTFKYPSYMENAYEFLDAKGEFYINRKDGYLYYRPRDFENPETMVATVPTGNAREFMLIGDSTQDKIHNIVFDNLAFRYTTWTYPNDGVCGSQANFFRDYQYKGDGRTYGNAEDPAVTVVDAVYVDFTNCEFSHLGGGGLTYREIMQHCNVIGNDFHDIGYAAVTMGNGMVERYKEMQYYLNTKYENYQIHNKINNNLIHDVAVNSVGSPALIATTLINTEIMHNEIYNVPYSGMHIGYGWGSYKYKQYAYRGFKIMYNYVHDTMREGYDGGCVYVLGHAGGTNELAYNYFENHRNGHGAIYLDEGSDRWQVYNNVVDLNEMDYWTVTTSGKSAPNWLSGYPNRSEYLGKIYNNWSTTNKTSSSQPTDGSYEPPTVVEDANWTGEARSVVDNAGISPEFSHLKTDSVQRLRLLNREQINNYIGIGEKAKIDVKAYGRKLTESDVSVMYYSTNEDVATVDSTGTVTGVGRGTCEIFAEYLEDDVIRRRSINISTDNPVLRIESDLETMAVLVGYEKNISVVAKTVLGIDKKIIPTVTFDDPTLAELTVDGTIKGLKIGETTMHVIWESDGIKLERDIPLYVSAYNKGEETKKFEEMSFKPQANDPFFKAQNWTFNGTNLEEGVLQVYGNKTTGQPTIYNTMLTPEQNIISFDMTIVNGGLWPSFTFNLKDKELKYMEQDTYLMGLNSGGVELQRFNNGERHSIYGLDIYNPVGGPLFPNKSLTETSGSLYNYGTKYSVTLGAIDVEEGVRIILILNGEPILDYVDKDPGYIKGAGYFGIYETTGYFQLEPFTGQKFIK